MIRHPHLLATALLGFAGLLLVHGRASAQAPRHGIRRLERPVANPSVASTAFRRALANGTRTERGVPGPNYWQQWAHYTISARLDVEAKRLQGTTRILYHNASPDSLGTLVVQLIQNFHRADALRHRPAEITGGYTFTRVALGDQPLRESQPGHGPGYGLYQTSMFVSPSTPVPPGDSVVLEMDWNFTIPQVGAGGRMGWNGDDLFHLAYWYPQMAVYGDVVGWHWDPFLGVAEFYAGFADYDVTLDVPQGWLVQGTGELRNAPDVLSEGIRARVAQAEVSDTVVHVITQADLDAGFTRQGTNGRLRWHFTADSVRDVAYAVTRRSLWDATRSDVGDRNGDGRPEYTRVDAIFRPSHERWYQTARYAQQSIAFHSRQTGLPYPYSHATVVEGDGIVGGGMEFPMVTLIGGQDDDGDRAMYWVTSHELAHNWVPMIVSTDERRRAWMDEGTTDYNANLAAREFFPDDYGEAAEFDAYVGLARAGFESALMRYSEFLDAPSQYHVYAYEKPGSLLITLRHLLGEDRFNHAYHGYLRTWAFKHPEPWDFFNYFNTSTGQDLDWFWRTFYYETWTLDQSVESVSAGPDGTEIVVRDLGDAPMPARLTITLATGDRLHREIPVSTWLTGTRTAALSVPRGREVTQVEIDADHEFPDVMRKNNYWGGGTDPVQNELVRFGRFLALQGYQAEGEVLSGVVGPRAADRRTVMLRQGVEYVIGAVCDEECGDIDLAIASPTDSILARDAAPDDEPVLRITAPATGEYLINLVMVSCRVQRCAWGGRIYRRP